MVSGGVVTPSDLLLFLDNETVPPTNYSSEQALRWSVVFCKVTHGFCSDWGAELFTRVAIYFGKRMTVLHWESIQ